MKRFDQLYFEMCFALQRRGLFKHLKLSKVFRQWGVLMCFDDLYFEMCFAPRQGALCKISTSSVSGLFYLFAHLHLLSSDSFSSSAFLFSGSCHFSILSEVWFGKSSQKKEKYCFLQIFPSIPLKLGIPFESAMGCNCSSSEPALPQPDAARWHTNVWHRGAPGWMLRENQWEPCHEPPISFIGTTGTTHSNSEFR